MRLLRRARAPFSLDRMRFGLIVLILLIAAVVSPAARAETLTVALYPYVPRTAQFEAAIRAAWGKVHPADQLNFINDGKVWDGGYHTNPPANVDVYVFDAMYFDEFVSNGFLAAMDASEVKNVDDFLPYARDAVMIADKYYAIPQLGCANILFYDARDNGVANATTLPQLKSSLNQCTYTSEIPPDRRGLMVDMNGSTTVAALYLDIAHSMDGTYPLPEPSVPDTKVTDDQRLMLTLGSYLNATSNAEDKTPYARGVWFNEGYGRAFMGFTEAMSVMSQQTLSNIGFKPMPLSGTTGKPPLFYADVIGVNKSTEQRGTRALAVELANVIASTDTIVASFKAQDGKNPQYLMSVRTSAFDTLEKDYPIYKRMHDLTKSNPVAFKLDKNAHRWVKDTVAKIRQQVTDKYSCGCDKTAPRAINNNADAQSVCPAVCQTQGGWNGQWTNRPPAPQPSVCGCNACALPQ